MVPHLYQVFLLQHLRFRNWFAFENILLIASFIFRREFNIKLEVKLNFNLKFHFEVPFQSQVNFYFHFDMQFQFFRAD